MKIIAVILLFFAFSVYGQDVLYNKGNLIRIKKDVQLYVKGSIVNDSSYDAAFTGEISNSGEILLEGDLIDLTATPVFSNNPTEGKLTFIGTGVQNIQSDSLQYLYQVELNKSAGHVQLNCDWYLRDTIDFALGKLDLNNRSVQLHPDSGFIHNENGFNNFYSSTAGGYVGVKRTFPIGSDPCGIGLVLNSFQNTPILDVRRYPVSLSHVADTSILRTYWIKKDQDTLDITINYFDTDLFGLPITETELVVYSSQDSLAWKNRGGTINPGANTVYTTGIPTDTTWITLAEDICQNPPVVNLGFDTINLCAGNDLLLDAMNPGAYYEWSDNSTNQTLLVNTTGQYHVAVTDDRGCIGYDTVEVFIRDVPTAGFTVDNQQKCEYETFNFSNVSSIASGTMSYHWDFGDLATLSDTSDVSSPSFLYSLPELYDVTLIVSSEYGCKDTASLAVRAHPQPNATFNMADACQDSLVSFASTSTVMSPVAGQSYAIMPSSYEWDFGDGTALSGQTGNQNHVYTSSGVFAVEMIVMSNAACYDTLVQNITIHDNPTAGFSIASNCHNTDIGISNLTTGAANYFWDFGNGDNSTVASPAYTYPNPGTYNLSLTAETVFGCSHTTIMSVTMDTTPTVNFNSTGVCQNYTTHFFDLSSNITAGASYDWSFGDGSPNENTQNPVHLYSLEGNYNVKLIIDNANGCLDSANQTLTINPTPVASFSAADNCLDSTINFTNNSSLSMGSVSYNWDFDDGNTSVLVNPAYAFSSAGIFNVELVATSDSACTDTFTLQVESYAPPVLNLGGTINTCGSSYILDAGTPGSSYVWSTTESTQTITVVTDGSYWVSVSDLNSCTSHDTVNVFLNVPLPVNLGVDTTVCDSLLLDAGISNANYLWSNSSTDQTLLTQNSGTFWVQVTDQNMCVGSDTIDLIVNYSPIAVLTDTVHACAGDTVILDALNPGANFIWNTGSVNDSVSTDTTGNFYVHIDLNGCYITDSSFVQINPVSAFSLGNDTTVCGPMILSPDTSLSNYLWSNSSTDSSLLISTSGNYWLNALNQYGCSYIDSINLTILTQPAFELGNDTVLCAGESIFLDISGSADFYNWNTGATAASVLADTSGTYSVIASNTNGCTHSDSILVSIDNPIVSSLTDSTYWCAGQALTLETGNTSFVHEWLYNGDIVSTTALHAATQTGMYGVSITSPLGCQMYDSTYVYISPYSLVADYLVASNVFEGDTIQFINVSAGIIDSSYWYFGDGVISGDFAPEHIYFVPGTYNAEYIAGNDYCSDTLVKQIVINQRSGPVANAAPEAPSFDILESNLYPNPNSGQFTLSYELSEEMKATIIITDLSGKLLYETSILADAHTQELSMEELPSGIYMLVLLTDKDKAARRFVKI